MDETQNSTVFTEHELKHPTEETRRKFLDAIDTHCPRHCWLWIGLTSKKGHPYIKVANEVVRADILALYLFKNVRTRFISKKCKNKNCVNPSHIMVAKPRRYRRGRR